MSKIALGNINGFSFAPNSFTFDSTEEFHYFMANDSAVNLITASNNGVLAAMTTYYDPMVVDILSAPMKATTIYEEVQKGDFATSTATFLSLELQGETASYGDFSQSGKSGHNAVFPQRQNYRFQTQTEWGDLQMEVAGKARLNYASNQQKAAALTIMRKTNSIYLLGVSGLQNYGLMNDPLLSAPASIGTAWSTITDANTIYASFLAKLYLPLVAQADGYIDASTKMKMVMSPSTYTNLSKINTYGQKLIDLIKGNFENIEFVSVPEFTTLSGELVQLIAVEVEGIPTAQCAFSERLRSHGVVRKESSFEEKKSSGAFGTVVYRPFCISQALGA